MIAMQQHYFPLSTPEAEGLKPYHLWLMLHDMNQEGSPYHGVLILKNGRKVLEATRAPYTADMLHAQFSATKSWTSTLCGIAQGEGLLDIHEHVTDFFPEYDLPFANENTRLMTLENLLTMSSGATTDPMGYFMGNGYEDWALGFLDYPVETRPGEHFFYSNGGSHMIMECVASRVRSRLGMDMWDFIADRLFEPLHIGKDDFTWWRTPSGVPEGAHGLYITMENMAKLGWLFLNGGKWEGRQLVPEDWVRTAQSVHIKPTDRIPERDFGYGYQWWAHPYGGFSAQGMGGQHVHCFPKENMVVVFTGGISMQSMEDDSRLLAQYVMPALGEEEADCGCEECALNRQLHDSITSKGLNAYAGLMESPVAKAVPDSAVLEPFCGEWVFPENAEELRALRVEYSGGTVLRLTLRAKNRGFCREVGLDGIYRVSELKWRSREQGSRCGLKANITPEGALRIVLHTVLEPFEDELLLYRAGERIIVKYRSWSAQDRLTVVEGERQ